MTATGLPPDEIPPRDLPPKREVAMVLLQSANSVYVHLDPREAEVLVPTWFKKQPQLVLQVGLNMAVPIVDLDVGEEALSCTLSFNRTPHYCFIPWDAVYALVDPDGRGMVWPDSVPPEVARASGPGRRAAGGESAAGAGGRAGKNTRPRLRLAEAPGEDTEPGEGNVAGEKAPSPTHAGDRVDAGLGEAGAVEATGGQHAEAGGLKTASPEQVPHESAAAAQSAALAPQGDSGGTPPAAGEEPGTQEAGKRRPPYLRLVK